LRDVGSARLSEKTMIEGFHAADRQHARTQVIDCWPLKTTNPHRVRNGVGAAILVELGEGCVCTHIFGGGLQNPGSAQRIVSVRAKSKVERTDGQGEGRLAHAARATGPILAVTDIDDAKSGIRGDRVAATSVVHDQLLRPGGRCAREQAEQQARNAGCGQDVMKKGGPRQRAPEERGKRHSVGCDLL
jgi:hypothetical protein